MAKLTGIKGGKNNFTKKNLVDLVASETEVTKKDTKKVIDSLFGEVIPQVTKAGGYITIAGFGTFKEKKTKARTMNLSAKQRKMLGTSAKTKKVSAKKYISFSSSKNY